MVRSRPARRTLYHLGLRPGQLPEVVLIPGDPDRVARIARHCTRAEPLARQREFVSYRAVYGGVPVGIVSSGIGGPAMAIVVEELARAGARTLIRVGSSGSLQPGVRPGELVITTAAARFDGTTGAYAPAGYPAVADFEVVAALRTAARGRGVPFHVGRTASVDSFYIGEGRKSFGGYHGAESAARRRELRELGLLNIEMEGSTLLTLAGLFGLRAGVLCAVYGDRGEAGPVPRGMDDAISVALDAARSLGSRPDGSPA